MYPQTTPEWIPIKHLMDTFDGKHLEQFSLTVLSSLYICLSFKKEFLRFSGSVIALNAFDLHFWSRNVSKEDNHRISIAESEPSITFSVASNIKDFWTMFETILKIHWNCILTISECDNNNGRLVLIAIWPEGVIEDEVGDLVEKSIRNNPLLRRFQHALGMDKNVFIIFPINENLLDTYHVYELYFVKDLLVVERVDSIILEEMLAFKYRRSNFRKVPIITVSQPDKRFSVQSKYMNVSGNLVLSGGYHYDLLRVLSWTLNFTAFNILGQGWIDKRPDGTLTGMGEQLLKGETDLILSRSEITLYRAEKISMIHPILGDRLEIYYRKPMVISLRNIYFSTFMPNVWVAVFIMWLMIGAVFVLFQFFKSNVATKCETQFENPASHWSNTIFWCVCATTQQACSFIPSATSLRVILWSGTVTSVIIYAVFSSIIVSRLSVEKELFNTLDDLRHEGFELYAQDVMVNALQAVQEITKKPTNTLSMELRAGIEKINTSKAAYVSVDSMFFGQEQNDSLCCFKSNMKIEGGRVYYALFMRYNDPIRVFFKYKFSKWDERGIHRRERQKFNRQALPVCDTTGFSDVKTISLVDVASALFIFGVGALISFSCLTAEIFTHSKKCSKVMSQFDSICE